VQSSGRRHASRTCAGTPKNRLSGDSANRDDNARTDPRWQTSSYVGVPRPNTGTANPTSFEHRPEDGHGVRYLVSSHAMHGNCTAGAWQALVDHLGRHTADIQPYAAAWIPQPATISVLLARATQLRVLNSSRGRSYRTMERLPRALCSLTLHHAQELPFTQGIGRQGGPGAIRLPASECCWSRAFAARRAPAPAPITSPSVAWEIRLDGGARPRG
jgi:hypothetical protein